MKKQINLFFTALMFFTRIPCPKNINHNSDMLARSTRYFSLVGILVGGLSAVSYYFTNFLTTPNTAIIVSIFTSILITGGFHEDGLADVCDAFGGGWTKEKILTIMKDSRVGTFGVLGLMITLLLKYQTLTTLQPHNIIVIMILGHSISRFFATLLIFTTPYVQDIDISKSKPNANAQQKIDLIICGGICLLAILLLQWTYLLTLIPLLTIFIGIRKYFLKWIGGHTGDCAGAMQQITEVVFYLSLIILWKSM